FQRKEVQLAGNDSGVVEDVVKLSGRQRQFPQKDENIGQDQAIGQIRGAPGRVIECTHRQHESMPPDLMLFRLYASYAIEVARTIYSTRSRWNTASIPHADSGAAS